METTLRPSARPERGSLAGARTRGVQARRSAGVGSARIARVPRRAPLPATLAGAMATAGSVALLSDGLEEGDETLVAIQSALTGAIIADSSGRWNPSAAQGNRQ